MSHYTKITKSAVEKFVREGVIMNPSEDLPEELLKRKAGVFVTIKKEGKLRACIGTYLPTKESLASEIIHNAIAAASKDDRFGPIKEEELPLLSYEVHILEEPEQIEDLGNLDPARYGIIVKGERSFRKSLLLPGLEGIDTPEEQILTACKKAGINPQKEKMSLFRFQAKKYQD